MKYHYSVAFALTGRAGCHVETFGNAPAAIMAARLAYAAVQTMLEPERDTLPAFSLIRRPECVRERAEPANRSFVVSIAKRAR